MFFRTTLSPAHKLSPDEKNPVWVGWLGKGDYHKPGVDILPDGEPFQRWDRERKLPDGYQPGQQRLHCSGSGTDNRNNLKR